jgi:PKD repeat protein
VVAIALVVPAGAAAADASGPGAVTAYPFVDPNLYTGATPDTAAASCWEIKQMHADAPSGAYWLLTPSMTGPVQVWCDQETDGGGWIKVGAGRNAWETLAVGRGNPATLLTATPAANATTTQLSAETVDGLLDGAPVTALTDGIRVRRAANTDGTSWQEVRFRPTKAVGWYWSMGAGWPLVGWTVGTTSGSSGSSSSFGSGSSTNRVDTSIGENHNYTWSFSYGNGVTGMSAASSYLWAPTDGQGGARPFAEVYIRPKLINPEVTFPAIADTGTGKIEKESVPDSLALPNSWGVTGLAGAVSGEGDVEVQALARIGSTMYVGGNFRYVQRDEGGSGRVEQSFLAAFNASTGEWISSFRPTFNEAVQALTALPDGRLAVGGRFTQANGAPATGLVVLNAATGATTPGWSTTMTNSVSAGVVRVLVLTTDDDYLYIGGTFTHTTGPNGRAAYARNAVRIALSTFNPDVNWRPEFNGSVQDTEVSEDGTKAYYVGFFSAVSGADAQSAAALLTSAPAQVDPTSWTPVWSSTGATYQQGVEQVGQRVYSGGAEHNMFSFDTTTYQRLTTSINNPKGDVQAIVANDTFLFAGSHSNNYYYTGATQWPSIGTAWSRADTIGWVSAWRLDDVSPVQTFSPTLRSRLGSGGWAVDFAPNGDIWVGGDFQSGRTTGNANRWLGAFVRFPMTDGTAPNSPTNFRITSQTSTTVALAWNAPAGGAGGGGYQVLRDDRPIATATGTTITVPKGGANRFFVRAVDSTGNVSASTPVVVAAGGNPAPVATITHALNGLDVQFDATDSTDDGALAAFYWDLGDGTLSSEPMLGHSYEYGGTYDVSLVVVDDQGAWTRAETQVLVVQPPPADPYGIAVFEDSPQLYWRLGETSGTVALDSATGSGRGNIYNGVSLGQADALIGTSSFGARFDGSNDHVVAQTAQPGPTVYSAEAWFSTTTTRGGKIIGFGDAASGLSSSYDRHVYMTNSGTLVFGAYTGSENRVTSPTAYNDGRWHHVVATQGADGMELYVDGALVGTNPQTGSQDYSGYWRIGGDRNWSGASSSYFNGGIDEAAVYGYALTPDQVVEHYALGMGLATPDATPSDAYGQEVLTDDPTAFWRLGSAQEGVVDDASAGYELGQVTGSAAFGGDPAVTGGPGSAAFTGNGFIAERSQRTTPTAFAIELWFSTTTGAGGKLIGYGSSATGLSSNYDRHVYMLTDGRLVFGVYSGSEVTITSPGSYNDGEWHHLVAQQGPAGMDLYVDGALIGSNAETAAQSYNGYWRVGGDRTWGSSGGTYFTGRIGEVAIYGESLAAGRIGAHYATGNALPNQAPTAAFTPTADYLHLSVDASASSDLDGTIASYAWDFGDGAVYSGLTATHDYAVPGQYTVTLVVTDDDGASNSTAALVEVVAPPNQVPIAAFTSSIAMLALSVDAQASYDPDGTITSYHWAFGDGSTASGPLASHTYAAGGDYVVVLTVTDDALGTDSESVVVHAVAPPNQAPTASFASTVDEMSVTVDASTSFDPDGTIASYAWDFGDGTVGTGVSASHTYALPGGYLITLTVTDDDLATGTTTSASSIVEPGGEPVTTTPVTMGDTWRWYYESAAPPTAWNQTGFDVSGWALSGARLGWGASSIVTNIDHFASTNDRPRAVYFVKEFQVPDASRVVELTLDTVADDGVVVYVNGTEVGRHNMRDGEVTHLTYASSARNTTVADGDPVVIEVPTSLLINGTNVIAAETHVNFRATRDVSFRLEATMVTTVAGGGTTPVNHAPTAQLAVTAGGLNVTVDGTGSSDSDGTIQTFAWSFGDGGTATGPTASHTYATPGDYTVTLTVTDDKGATGSATTTVSAVDPSAATESVPVAMDAPWYWRYAAGAPPTDWNQRSFDPSGWSQGGARLGFGSPLIVTNVDTFATTQERPPAAYFVHRFEIDDASGVVSLRLDTVADDGVVVYVNGVEVGRHNMPDGTVTFQTYAPSARNITVADGDPVVFEVPASLLVDGTNVIAAETHVNYRATRDMSFRLKATMLSH